MKPSKITDECVLCLSLGPIHIIPDSSCTTFLTESDIKILHVHTISDSVLGSVQTTPLRFKHVTKPFV